MHKKIKLKIGGIHCKSCKSLIETEVKALPGVGKIEVDHISGNAIIEFDDERINKEKIYKEIEKLNYKPEEAKIENNSGKKSKNGDIKSFIFGFIIPIALVLFIVGFFLISKGGGFEMLSRLNEGNVSYGLIFIIGLLAGFHCVGMCSGLIIAYCAPQLKDDSQSKKINLTPHLRYNAGRLISYTLVGGILGGIGSFFGINPTFTGAVTVAAGAFMVLMGLSFVKNWSPLEKIKPRTPQFIAKFLFKQKHEKNSKGPFVVGFLTGFMPCGPLQAMQLYALASGSVFRGGASLAIYALGTMPLLFGFGAAITSIGQRYVKNILKFSGVLIIVLGLFMANRGLANFGYGFKFSFIQKNTADKNITVANGKGYQTVNMDLTYLGYKPNILYIKKGQPVRWVINVKEMSGCTNAIVIESLGIKKDLQYGENIIEFTPPDGVKEIKFSCWMRMVWGKFVITDDGATPASSGTENKINALPAQGSCGGSCGGGGGSGGCGCGGGGSGGSCGVKL